MKTYKSKSGWKSLEVLIHEDGRKVYKFSDEYMGQFISLSSLEMEELMLPIFDQELEEELYGKEI